MILLDSFEVDILEDPYGYLESLAEKNILKIPNMNTIDKEDEYEQLCLRLYTIDRTTKEKVVNERSGLNQWNANGRIRNKNEIYIPYPAEDRIRSEGFFPPRDENFELMLPDGKTILAKVCQENGKAIMSNPNSDLGKWLLRDVFELEEGKIVTYEMLEIYGIDSVIFTKIDDKKYKINFTDIGTYEKLLGLENDEE
jgi:restriction endonuclease